MESLVCNFSSDKICDYIMKAEYRIVYLAPGMYKKVSKKLLEKLSSNNEVEISIILDSNPEIYRIGYGDLEALEELISYGIEIKKGKGVRIGLLVIDNNAWVFTPTALIIEDEPSQYISNALKLNYYQIKSIIKEIDKSYHENDVMQISLLDNIDSNKNITVSELDTIKSDLEIRPPQKFDLARAVSVYSSFIQFVDLKLIGFQFNRKTIVIPEKLLKLSKDGDDRNRIKATYKLFDKKSSLNNKLINQKIIKIRKAYLKSLGEDYGTIILKQKKEKFIKEIENIKLEIDKFKEKSKKKIDSDFEKCIKDLRTILLPQIIKNTPDELINQIENDKPTGEQAKTYLDNELKKILPKSEDCISNMELKYTFKDVTYEMLNDENFQIAIKRAFPYVEWTKAFKESDAILSKKDNNV